jgi:hypothetical protein
MTYSNLVTIPKKKKKRNRRRRRRKEKDTPSISTSGQAVQAFQFNETTS